jgi:hypothetical protein
LEWVHNFFWFSNLYFLWNSLIFPLQLIDGLCFFVFPPPFQVLSPLQFCNGLFLFLLSTFNFFLYWKFKVVIKPSDYKPNMKVTIF